MLGLYTPTLGYVVSILRLLGRRFRNPLCHDGFLSLGLRPESHLLGYLRLADGFIASLLGQNLLTVGYLLHLLAHTTIDIRLFLLPPQFIDLRLQFTNARLIALAYKDHCPRQQQQQHAHTSYDRLV